MSRPRTARAAPLRPRLRPSTAALLAVAAFLFATVDDRHGGRTSDEYQMVYTSVALAERGTLALAPDARLFNPVVRPDGTAVSRYGIGTSLTQLPAALLAPGVERRLGPGASAPLFLLAPLLLLLACGWAAGETARLLGGTPAAGALAVALATVASPLAAYGSSILSEPLQAACLVLSLVAAVASALEAQERKALLLAAAAGAAAGAALLAKTTLLAVSPLLLLPLLGRSTVREKGRGVLAAAAGAAVPLGAWAALERARFGHLLGGYPGESFSHPLFDGLARLLFLPNRGLLLFYPAAALAVAGIVLLLGRGQAPVRRFAALGVACSTGALLAAAATWWCWHGFVGWGPRLVVPAVPLLAPFAALALDRARASRPVRIGVVGLCLLLNLPPLLANPGLVAYYTNWCSKGVLSAEVAATLPSLVRVQRDGDGRLLAGANLVLPLVPSAAPHVVYPWFAAATFASTPEETAERLRRPPWRSARPDVLSPRFLSPATEIPMVAPLPRWGWGRSFLSGAKDPALTPLYLDALSNQVQAALAAGPPEAALELAEKFRSISPAREADAFLLEALRKAGKRDTAADFVRSLTPAARSWPDTAAAIALWARDAGALDLARRAMRASSSGKPGEPYAALRDAPPESWPKDLLSAR